MLRENRDAFLESLPCHVARSVLILCALASPAWAIIGLRESPVVTALRVDPANPAHLFVLVRVSSVHYAPERLTAGESFDGGATFAEVDPAAVPLSYGSELASDFFRYWFGLRAFLKQLDTEQFERGRAAFDARYGPVLQLHSRLWMPTFVGLSLVYLGTALVLLARKGWAIALRSILTSACLIGFIAIGFRAVSGCRTMFLEQSVPVTSPVVLLLHIGGRLELLILAFLATVFFFPSTIDIFRLVWRNGEHAGDRRFFTWQWVSAAFWGTIICGSFIALVRNFMYMV